MVDTAEMKDRYRWVVLGVLWITYIVVFLHRLSVGPLAPFLKENFGLTSAQVGLTMAAASMGYMVSIFPTGWVVDKIGAKWPIVVGTLIAGVSMLSVFFISSYIGLLILTSLTGMGCGFLFPSTTQGVIVWFGPGERATAMGLKQTAVNIGGILSAATLPSIALALGWRYCFLFLGFISLAVGVLACILYRDPPNPIGASVSAALPTSEIFKSQEIWLLAFSGLFLTWVEMALITHLVLYLREVLLMAVVAAGGLLAFTQAAGAIARPITGVLSDQLFQGKRKGIFMLMAATALLMVLILGFFGSYLSWMLYPILFFLGVGAIGFGGIYITLLSEFGGHHGAGKAVGLGGMLVMIGSALGPIAFGHIVDISGSYRLAWLSLAFVSALCLGCLLFVNEEKKKI